ncbi:hypothetical protein ACWV95_20205 [Streptomyces albus]
MDRDLPLRQALRAQAVPLLSGFDRYVAWAKDPDGVPVGFERRMPDLGGLRAAYFVGEEATSDDVVALGRRAVAEGYGAVALMSCHPGDSLEETERRVRYVAEHRCPRWRACCCRTAGWPSRRATRTGVRRLRTWTSTSTDEPRPGCSTSAPPTGCGASPANACRACRAATTPARTCGTARARLPHPRPGTASPPSPRGRTTRS